MFPRQVFGLAGSTLLAGLPRPQAQCRFGVRACLPLRGSSGLSPDSLFHSQFGETKELTHYILGFAELQALPFVNNLHMPKLHKCGGRSHPRAYIIGGVIFPWYFWTPNWLCYTLVCYAAIAALFALRPGGRAALILFLAAFLVSTDAAQWLISRNIGLQEYHYRADVGRWLHQVARPGDTLELEPAGYIPYYANLKTYDQVGLVSPLVLSYRERYGGAWWIEFLKRERPAWFVDRENITEYITMDGVHLSPQDSRWFGTSITPPQTISIPDSC